MGNMKSTELPVGGPPGPFSTLDVTLALTVVLEGFSAGLALGTEGLPVPATVRLWFEAPCDTLISGRSLFARLG